MASDRARRRPRVIVVSASSISVGGDPSAVAHGCYNCLSFSMRILMIAPEPFFEPRGTPFSEYHRIRALLELGHTVDLVTYPFGRDVALPGLRVFRCAAAAADDRHRHRAVVEEAAARSSRCSSRRAAARWREKYDAVHSHEEGSWFGVVLAGAARRAAPLRHALEPAAAAHQLRLQPSRLVKAAFGGLERFVIRRSRVVIVICPQLEEVVRGIDAAVPSVLIENAPGSGDAPTEGSGRGGPARAADRRRARRSCSTPERSRRTRGSTCCSRRCAASSPRGPTRGWCWPAGGPIRSRRRGARPRRPASAPATIFAGQRPAEEIPAYLDAADVLVSPRSLGHQHAAEDLPVPAIGPSDRRDAPADAHAGAGRRGRVPDRGDARRLRRRASSRRSPIRSAPAPSARAPGISPRRNTATRPTWRARARPARTSSASAAPQMAGGVA